MLLKQHGVTLVLVTSMTLLLTVLAIGDLAAQTADSRQHQWQQQWKQQWPRTDFSRTTVNLDEILSGGPGKDGIPAIDQPRFVKLSAVTDMVDEEPVIGVVLGNEAKAYPLRILMWHEIVNDEVGGIPVAVTYCPLCNTSIVFERRLDGQLLDFGTTGNLRHSDMVMYDRQTESWWQQYAGNAIAGTLAGKKLQTVAARLESFGNFRRRAPAGLVLVPNDPQARDYGANPYVGYDRSPFPFLFQGATPKGVAPMMRVVAIGDVAFTLPLLMERGQIQHGGISISWTAGQRSALDSAHVAQGQDIGNFLVSRDGKDLPYVVTFAFAFFAFNPEGILFTLDGQVPKQQ